MEDFDVDRVYEALKAADRAGDVEAARALATRLREWQTNLPREQRIQQIKAANPSEYVTAHPGYQDKYGPLGSGGKNALAGAGKAFVDIGRGAQQIVGAKSTAQIDESRRLDAPLMKTKAGIAGNIGGGVAATLPTMFIPGANTYTGAGLIGAGVGALQPVGTGESRLTNAAFGAGAGLAGRYLGGKISDWAAKQRPQPVSQLVSEAEATGGAANATAGVQGTIEARGTGGGINYGSVGDDASASITGSQRRLIEAGNKLGLKVTPGQASGSKALQQMEAKLESQPMTSGPFNQIKADNAKGITRAFLKAIGEEGDEASAAVLSRADDRIGAVFEKAAQNNSVLYDDALQASLSNIEASAANELSSSEMGILKKQFQTILDKAASSGGAPRLSGSQYQNIRQSLGRLSGNSSTGVGFWARQIRDSLDDALERSAGDNAGKALRTARDQYRILATAMNRTGAVNQTGMVQPGILANAIAQSDKKGYALGRNASDLYEALRFAQAFKSVVGDSGTATRQPIAGAFDFAARIPYNLAARAYTSAPSVRAASYAGPLARTVGDKARNVLGTAPFYAPFVLPGQAGLLGSELGKQ